MSTVTPFIRFLLIWNSLFWAVPVWLFLPVLPGGWWTVAAGALLLAGALWTLVLGFTSKAYPGAATRLLIYRPLWYIQLFVPLLTVAGVVGVVLGLALGEPRSTGRGAILVALALLAVFIVWGYLGTRCLVVKRLQLRFPQLPEGLEGVRIVQLSDLHVGPHTSKRHLARVAEAVQAAEPHLVVLTGDQVDDFPRDVEPLGRALGGMTAPLGIFAVPGNHDVYAGWTAVREGMEALGWTVLVNRSVPLEWNGVRFRLAGTGDPAGYGGPMGPNPTASPDVPRTLAGIPPGEFVVVLAHNPALWPALANAGADLTLSGHTHYGQVAIPRMNWCLASPFLRHAMGVHRAGKAVLYINPGTNYWGIPLRIGTPSEVTVIELGR